MIDDPDSIVKCTNKIFLEQLMSKLKINRPKSFIFNRELMQKNLANITYPCIIKSPDSAFSQGVFKAKTKEEFLHITKKMFEETDLILIQEFLPTDFDWRIGVLNNEVIYACKYYMAEGHWQIIQNQENKDPNYGNFESIDPSKVDDKVLKMALKSTKYIGNGLYGVDLKQKDKDVYMIEVNDNPSIDAGVEDDFLGDELYLKIMRHFLAECNKRRKPHE